MWFALSRGLLRAVLLVAITALAGRAMAEDGPPSWAPGKMFVQVGHAEAARSIALGLGWTPDWQRSFAGGQASLSWEVSLGRWISEPDHIRSRAAWVTQIGLTPVLRWQPDADSRWFLEGGIGANVLLPIYQRHEKRFSTAFNFGDHLGLGYTFGEARQHELAFRVQHFSNGGIKLPNPGENFRQLRYTYAF